MDPWNTLDALIGTSAFIEDIFQELPIGIAVSKIDDDRYVYTNARFSEVLGWPECELTDKQTLLLKVFPDDEYRQAIVAKMQGDIKTGNQSRMVWEAVEIVTSTGEKRFINIKSIPVKSKDYTISTVRDVTEEVLKTRALEAARNDLKRIMDSSIDMIFAIDTNDIILSVNAASESILGYKPEEMVGRPIFDFIYPPDKQRSVDIARTVKAGLRLTNVENHYVHKNGSLVPLHWSAVADPSQRVRYGIARDATEIKKSKAALIESEKLYRYLFDNNPVPISIWDFETKQFIDCNEEAAHKYGYTKEEFLQLTIRDIRPPEDWPLIDQFTQSEQAYGQNHQRTWRHIKKNGELMYMNVQGELINYNGRRASIVIAQDVTETKYYLELDTLEKQVLECSTRNEKPLSEVIGFYLAGMEALHKGLQCSVLEKRGDKLFGLAAPSLPGEFWEFPDGLTVADQNGICGTAAWLKERVIVPCMAADSRLEGFREILARHPMKSCWSYPIIDGNNEVIATFALYNCEERPPSKQEENTIERGVHLLHIIMENHRRHRDIAVSNERFEYVMEATFDVIWDWNLEANSVYYSNNMQKLFGHRAGTSYDNLPFFFENVHPEDRERAVLYPDQVKYSDMIHWTQEYRFRKANGEYANILGRGIVIRDENGIGKRMIGAMQDISTLRKQHERLTEIALINSHEIRKPIASILGLMQLFKDIKDQTPDEQLLQHLESATQELDEVIKRIINKTEDL
ncbi:PAS domain S-box protein [Mucilaginibacter sp. BT774]|uniref:PAS domain S-box protein n=1 Tax=Mucilaginibacter sp. BT774 TaxID=3062276 RepID=UPI002676A166|nr:PAS domain S-box protein [Mucilaginibacter sp. BT774]MDO3624695.1 PAS domain S-box protein [Mucilaginibacter sp. BT774]